MRTAEAHGDEEDSDQEEVEATDFKAAEQEVCSLLTTVEWICY